MRRQLLDFPLLSILLIIFASQNSATAKGLTFAELKQRSIEVENMTRVERESLQRNWQTFQALSEDQKQSYRLLHQELEADRKVGNQLNETLQTYELWLQTLAPGERVALREATSPVERLRIVREIKADKERRNQSRALNDPAEDSTRSRGRFWRNLAPPLSATELTAVMDALAAALPHSDQGDLKRFDPEHDRWLRYQRIIEASARQADGPQNWPNLNQQAAMAAAIPKSEPARVFKNLLEDQRRGQWARVIFSSCGDELARLRDPFRPKEIDLARVFEHLEPRDREKLMSVPKEWLKLELTRRYFRELENKDPEYQSVDKAGRDFFDFAKRFMGQAGFYRGGGPPGPGRRFSGPAGPRSGRPLRNDRDRDGPPPNRPPREDRGFQPPPPEGDRPQRRPDRPRDGE